MFDFSFGELMLIGAVALVVIGPERLPKVARTAGILMGRMQRYVAGVKADISREMEELEQLKDLKNLRKEVEAAGSEIESSVRQNMLQAESEAKKIAEEVGPGFAKASGTISPTPQVGAEPAVPPPPETNLAATQTALPQPGAVPETPSPQLELSLDDPASTSASDPAAPRAA
jgi:sec-independent protein translocase protein TatB